MTISTVRTLLVLLCVLLHGHTRSVQSFLFQACPPRQEQASCLLLANKVSNKNKKSRKKKSTPPMGGGGFGGAPTSASPSTKVRSISGFSGSGTKPLRVAANTFDALRSAYGKEACSDVYVRSPLNNETLFWYVGKVAYCTNQTQLQGQTIPTADEACVSQKRLILEYAKRELRPQNMGPPFDKGLELWLAPGDSEMDTVQNKVSFTKVTGSVSTLSDGFHVADVGFNPEIYVGDEINDGGLRVVRDEHGHPVKDVFEVNESL